MKTMSCLLVLCLLFQSCFSYRKIDIANDQITLEKKYKLWTIEGEKKKLIIKDIDDTNLFGASQKEQNIIIPITDIDIIKKRKFSIIKTIGLPVLITGGLFALFLTSFQLNINIGSPSYN